MYKWFYQDMQPQLPLFAMFVFLILFGGVVVRLFAYKNRADFRRDERLPLADDNDPSGVTP